MRFERTTAELRFMVKIVCGVNSPILSVGNGKGRKDYPDVARKLKLVQHIALIPLLEVVDFHFTLDFALGPFAWFPF